MALELITISGTSLTYDVAIVIGRVEVGASFSSLGFFTLAQRVDVSQFTLVAGVIQGLYIELGVVDVEIVITGCEQYIFEG